MTVGIYIRVSTEEQVRDGFSISAQREKLKAYCIAQDWNSFKFYVDEGISAKDTNRPQLNTMLEHIKQGLINTVLVYRLDRLTRSVMDLYKLLDTFDKYNCAFKSATEVYDTSTAMGRMFITIVAALAQWERENLGERVRMGQLEKARQGEYSAKAPFGFDKNEHSKLIINPEESKVVLDMVGKIEEGYSIRQLADHLDSYIKPIRGYKWHIRTILNILSNHAMYGAIRWSNEIIENAHPGIITKDRFMKVQQLLSSRQNFKKRKTTSIFIFQMKLLCPNCGNHLTCERVRYHRKKDNKDIEHNRYRCQACVLNKKKAFSSSETKIEKAFLDYIDDYRFTKVPEFKKEDDEKEILKKKLSKIERQREKFQKAWSNDLMTDEEFAERMKETKNTLEEIKSELNKLGLSQNEKIDSETVRRIVNDIKNKWSLLSSLEKKQFMNLFVKNIQLKKINEKNIVVNITFY
ncbi:recombinase family protein [Bacillus paranthracis]|uniref:Putative site-specific recombinase n=1 Tax=uncultured Caudovirales phage TaxID=2100421 RepID=A0A2H4J388_9CAUD|nr:MULTISPECIES: recombinase family protein [Bacillus cereus group]ASN69614.1 putative site-specific recombinase [uncultured Caudovirales phage]ONG71151.1 recombinase family protein [Bacillus cereus]MCU5387404.1 recombinase family protein [Bacillus paranthracis]MDA1824589.1 recombinase family protein [Bacillus cereus group sp. BY25LC]MDA2192050.1 recombinase family protein [Bacillus cereus group sp. Bc238]